MVNKFRSHTLYLHRPTVRVPYFRKVHPSVCTFAYVPSIHLHVYSIRYTCDVGLKLLHAYEHKSTPHSRHVRPLERPNSGKGQANMARLDMVDLNVNIWNHESLSAVFPVCGRIFLRFV